MRVWGLSPFKLPLKPGLHEHRDLAFGPLPGLFEESLPDGWGLLLMDRHFRREGVKLTTVSPLDRLAYLGERTMGALTYHPPGVSEAGADAIDLFELGQHAQDVVAGSASDILTRNHADTLRCFRQMVFNVAAHVRDDHTKNFAFLLSGRDEWALTPAYDLTFSSGPGGEHAMSVAGEAREPTAAHCRAVATGVGISTREASDAVDSINAAIRRWPEFADQACCPRAAKRSIAEALRVL